MQNIKPLQTNRKIMSNKEAMEELERYKPPKEEPKENLETKLDNNFKDNNFYKEALELYKNINSQIGKDGILYKWESKYQRPDTHSNALMAILCKLLGKDNEALELYEGINRLIGKKGIFYVDENITKNVCTEDNALMAILLKLLGEDKEAEKLFDGIKKANPKGNKLYAVSIGCSTFKSTNSSATMAVLCKLLGKDDEALELYKNINECIGKEDGLYNWEVNESYDSKLNKATRPNALMAILCKFLGKDDEALELYKNINNKIKKEGKLYNQNIEDSQKDTTCNATMAILCYLLSGKGLKCKT